MTGADHVELEGSDHWFWVDDAVCDAVVDEIEQFLTGSLETKGADRALATVLFTDIVRSTETAAALGDARWKDILDMCDRVVSEMLDRHRGRLVKHTGDGHLATFDGPGRGIRCAQAIRSALQPLGLELRTGLHAGEVEMRGDDVSGIAVHIAARVMAEAAPGQILVSGAIPPLVAGSGLEFREVGGRVLKGVPGEWQLAEVID